jgi:hypothetical protein
LAAGKAVPFQNADLFRDFLAAGGWGTLLPALFVAVVVEDEGGDAALRIALEGEAGGAGAVGIEE